MIIIRINSILEYYDARYENMVVTDENGNNLNYTLGQGSNGYGRMDIQVNKQLEAQMLMKNYRGFLK